eukprot:1069894-Prorocentrum_minimum.AAC.3
MRLFARNAELFKCYLLTAFAGLGGAESSYVPSVIEGKIDANSKGATVRDGATLLISVQGNSIFQLRRHIGAVGSFGRAPREQAGHLHCP